VALLTSHYDNSAWLADMGEALAGITVDQMILTLDVAGRRFRVDPEKLLRIEHLGQIAEFLQHEETQIGLGKIRQVYKSVCEIHALAFHREQGGPEGDDAGEAVQPVPSAQAGG
jgi:hypothetical protein